MPSARRQRRDLERRVQRTLQDLDVASPLDMEAFCRRLGEARGRPLTLRALPLPVPGIFGFWMATDDTDVIAYQSETTPAHQRLILLHEVGHIMAGHTGAHGDEVAGLPEPSDDVLATLAPDLPLEMVRNAFRRENYSSDDEREAELVGSIILNWASRIDLTSPPSATTRTGRRLQRGLGDRTGWR